MTTRPDAPDRRRRVSEDRASPTVSLRPGVRVVRRDDRHRQVGLDDLAVVVADHPSTRPALDDLAAGRALERSRIEPRLLGRLEQRGLLVDAALLARLTPAGTQARDAVLAAFAAHGPDAEARVTARRAASVEVLGPPAWAADARRLLTVAGIPVRAAPLRPAPGRPARVAGDRLLLVLAGGEPRRGDLDDAVREGRPHLVVATVQGRFRVGPFVVPGVTACLRCLDAHGTERDPRRALVVEQQGAAGEPDGIDPVLGGLALAHAVRDVVAWAEGDRPLTWSAIVDVDAGNDLVARRLAPHPCCGCGWGDRLAVP